MLITPSTALTTARSGQILPCRLALRVDPRRRLLAARAFELVGMTWGVRFVLVDSDASLVYSETPARNGEDAITIRCDPAYYMPGGDFRRVERGSEIYWTRGDAADADDVGTIVRFLGLLDDPAQPPGRRARHLSAPSVGALSEDRRSLASTPLVDHAARRIVERAGFRATGGPGRWPGGKTYAVCLTHDIDSPEIGNPRELLRSAAKAVVRRERKYWWSLGRGLAALTRRRAGEFWSLAEWQQYERELGIRSAFYVYPCAPGVPRHFNDPRYRVEAEHWSILETLAAEGWEIGVHNAIRSREATAHLLREKQALERWNVQIDGARHHYWEIDWRDPWTTLRRKAEAGYRYDASIAWKDAPGFRCGTAHPFFPWDPSTGERIDLVAMPTCLMDGHLFEHLGLSGEPAVEAGLATVEAVRSVGGLAVLDWHERTFADTPMYPGWRNVLDRLLDHVQSRGDAWLALPREIAAHVEARAQATRIEGLDD